MRHWLQMQHDLQKKFPGVNNVNIEIVWEPAWTMDKMTEEGKLKIKEMGANGLNTPAPN